MSQIVPRWEWRTFGKDFASVESKIQSFTPEVRTSKEVYILSRKSDDNTKIRNQLMDIKHLVQRDQHGLEQWNPLLKATFPLSADDLSKLAQAWKIEIGSLDAHTWSLVEFLQKFVAAHPDLKAVEVEKERHGCKIEDCIVEFARLKFDSQPILTVGVEHEDPKKILRVIALLGIEGIDNTNYIQALKRFLGF